MFARCDIGLVNSVTSLAHVVSHGCSKVGQKRDAIVIALWDTGKNCEESSPHKFVRGLRAACSLCVTCFRMGSFLGVEELTSRLGIAIRYARELESEVASHRVKLGLVQSPTPSPLVVRVMDCLLFCVFAYRRA